MYLNWHHIIDFIIARWGLTKKDIADKLGYTASKLSRKPIRFEPDAMERIFKHLFKLKPTEKDEQLISLAFEKKEKEVNLLSALKTFLAKAECFEAKYINSREKRGDSYEEIMMELLKRANTQPSKSEQIKTEDSVPNNKSGKTVSQDEDENYDKDEILSELQGWIGQFYDEQRVAVEMVVHPLIKEAIQSNTLSRVYEAFTQVIGEY